MQKSLFTGKLLMIYTWGWGNNQQSDAIIVFLNTMMIIIFPNKMAAGGKTLDGIGASL